MPYTHYPTAADIELALKSNSIWPDDENPQLYARRQAQIVADGARDQFENLTGWGPTLAKRDTNGNLVVQTRYYQGGDHNGDLHLKAGLLRLDSVVIDGVVQTKNYEPYFQHFTSDPDSAIIAIQSSFFNYGGYGGSYGFGYARGKRVAITGVWGKFLLLPDDVFEVCQHKAIANMMDYILNEQSLSSLSQDGFSKQLDIVGVRTQQNIAETGAKGFNDLVSSHTRPYLG